MPQVDRLKHQVVDRSLLVTKYKNDMNNALGFKSTSTGSLVKKKGRHGQEEGGEWIEPQVREYKQAAIGGGCAILVLVVVVATGVACTCPVMASFDRIDGASSTTTTL